MTHINFKKMFLETADFSKWKNSVVFDFRGRAIFTYMLKCGLMGEAGEDKFIALQPYVRLSLQKMKR